MRGLRGLVLMISVLVVGAAVDQARANGPMSDPRYRLSRDGGGLGYTIDETVIFSRVGITRDPKSFWTVERKVKEVQLRTVLRDKHQWADGRSCPALKTVLTEMAKLPPLKMAGPDDPVGAPAPFDVAETRLAGPAAGDQKGWAGVQSIRSEYFGPLPRWWARSLKAMANCWRDEPPRTSDGPVRSLLDTPEQVRWMKP